MIYRTCLLLMLSLGLAQARSAPYTDWAFDAQRAKKNKDLDALGALVVKKPEFARIFFYGQIYSLVTPGIPDKEKSRLRVRLERIAAVLAEQSPPDFRPQLLLDRVDSGQLVEEARASRDLQEQLILAARAGAQLPARVAAVEHIEIAEGVFYNILFRAEIARRRLGGRDERALLLHLAHHVAEGFVLAHGDLRTWETLKSWHSGRVPLEGMPFLSERLAQAFTAKLKGDLPLSLKMMNEALQAAQRSRGGSIFTALVMNGTAFIAGWMNKHEEERRIHLQVLQAVRPLGKPSLIALLSGQMVRSHLADKLPHFAIVVNGFLVRSGLGGRQIHRGGLAGAFPRPLVVRAVLPAFPSCRLRLPHDGSPGDCALEEQPGLTQFGGQACVASAPRIRGVASRHLAFLSRFWYNTSSATCIIPNSAPNLKGNPALNRCPANRGSGLPLWRRHAPGERKPPWMLLPTWASSIVNSFPSASPFSTSWSCSSLPPSSSNGYRS